MKKTPLLISFVALFFQTGISQTTTIANYDFNSSGAYPLSPNSNASGITCSASSSEPFQVYTGVATSSLAFVQNTTAGNALAMANSSGTNTRYFLFQLGGSELNTYQSYKIYMQPQRSTTGATLVTVAYSTNGSSYTNLSTTYPVTAAFTDLTIDLSSVSTLNNTTSLYIKLMVSGTTATAGTIRIDNFQIQATKGTIGGGSNPWQVNGNDVGFMGKVGIGTSSPAFPLDVTGEARIGSNLQILGNATINGEMKANSLSFGDATNKVMFSTALTSDGARIASFGSGPYEPIPLPPTTCMKPFITGDLQQRHRFTITKASSTNMLDMTNDGTNGFIDYGFDINQFQVFDANNPASPRPALKLNSVCWGDVEIAKGGGFASMGNYFEVGYPVRNGNIASNIFANGRVGQRITVTTLYPVAAPNQPTIYNTQLFVNRNTAKALAVFNTLTNANGDEVFVVYGDGKVGIGTSLINNPFNYKLAVNGTIGCKAFKVEINSSTWSDFVFEKDYKLMPLKELENYITKNKHLPNIPSNADIDANNGVDVVDVESKLLQKVEELTLYIIQQQKEIEALKKAIKK